MSGTSDKIGISDNCGFNMLKWLDKRIDIEDIYRMLKDIHKKLECIEKKILENDK